jgi:predicted nucleic acid-binding protein
MATLRVVLDANVLWPMILRDSLLRLATPAIGLYEPLWSEEILGEMTRSIVEAGKSSRERMDRTVRLMNETFPDSRLDLNDEAFTGLELPDPDDVHVLAAARESGAHYIVTFNVKHFPGEDCDAIGVEVLTPDQFLMALYRTSPEDVLDTLAQQVALYRQPPRTFKELLEAFAQIGLGEFAFTVPEAADLPSLELAVDEYRRLDIEDD